MKLKTMFLMMLVIGLMSISTAAFAKPERLPLKDSHKRAGEAAAKAQIKTIDLQNIEDPEARHAIGEILNYLNLQSQK